MCFVVCVMIVMSVAFTCSSKWLNNLSVSAPF